MLRVHANPASDAGGEHRRGAPYPEPGKWQVSPASQDATVPGEHRALCAVTSKVEKDAQAIFDFSHYFLRQQTPSGDKSLFGYRANCFA